MSPIIEKLHNSVLELENALTLVPHQHTQITSSMSIESIEDKTKKAALTLMDVMPLMTMASLSMEIEEFIREAEDPSPSKECWAR